jgi:hypothetical protein
VCQNAVSLYLRGREVRRNRGDVLPACWGWALTFDVVFGVFAAAMAVIAGLCVRWAVSYNRETRRLKEEPRDGGGSGR